LLKACAGSDSVTSGLLEEWFGVTSPREERGQFVRLAAADRGRIPMLLDGMPIEVLSGDTLLTGMLLHARHVRWFEFAAEKRAGFCLMGACQDCWVDCGERGWVRACTTF